MKTLYLGNVTTCRLMGFPAASLQNEDREGVLPGELRGPGGEGKGWLGAWTWTPSETCHHCGQWAWCWLVSLHASDSDTSDIAVGGALLLSRRPHFTRPC